MGAAMPDPMPKAWKRTAARVEKNRRDALVRQRAYRILARRHAAEYRALLAAERERLVQEG